MLKRYTIFILLFAALAFDGFGQTTFTWNFGTTSGNAAPSGSLANVTVSSVTQGNNNGTTTLLTNSSVSSGYTGASGAYNAGAAARTGVLNTASSGSAYFEFTLTPDAGKIINLTTISFGTRSTSTAPQAYSLRSSFDSYASDIATGTISNTSAWALKTNTGLTFTGTAGTAVTFRIYGYNGTGSAGANTANWRIDDLSIVVSLTSSGALNPPALTAAAINNDVDHNIDITFTEDAIWRGVITAVKINGTSLNGADYTITAGNLQLKPSNGNTLLTTSGSKSVSIEATGYNNATVSQVINPGAPTANSTATTVSALVLGQTRTVTATAKDQYSNLVPGYSFKYDVNITNDNVTTSESYTIDGTARTSSVANAIVTTPTNASGVATFNIVVPSQIDQSDGLSVQVQLSDGTTDIGTPKSIVGPDPDVVFTGVDPTTNSFAVGSTNNILYRIRLDVTKNPATLNGATFTIDGSFAASDISTSGYKLYYSSNDILEPGTDDLLESLSAANDNAELLGFTTTKLFAVGTGYLFLTVDLEPGAGVGNILSITTPVIADFTFTTNVTKSGTFNAAELHAFAGLPPALTADVTNNTVDNDIDITFTDDATWRGQISAVKINGTSLASEDYTITAGNLRLKPSNANPLLTTSGSKTVAIAATDYGTATVVQAINAGAPTTNSTASISASLILNSTRTVTLTAKDQYNNLVAGYNFKYDATITDANATTDESYTIDGTDRTSSISDLVVTMTTNAGGISTFNIIIPAVVDANDGINVQVQLTDGTTNIGSAFSFGNQPTIAITGTDPGSGNFIVSSSENILYRYQIAVTSASVILNQLIATLAGTYQAVDLGTASLKLFYSTNATLDGADTQIGTNVSSVSAGSGEDISFTGIGKILPIGTSYIFLTTDINYDATLARTISGSSDNIADFTIAESFTNGTHNFAAANSHTIVAIPGAPTDLFISEYVEGTSNNKYIEIYNGTGADVDLTDYKLGLAANGAASPTLYQLYTTLPSGSVKVYKNSSATDLVGVDDSASNACNFNGDDAIALYKVSTDSYVDIFGQIGNDPGTAWTVNGNTTVDKTLRRKSSITQGVTTNPGSGFPTLGTEWDMFNIDIVSGLGSHSISAFTSSYTQAVTTGSNNYNFLNTGLRINFVNVTTGANISVTRYEGSPTGTTGITESNVSNFRWVIEGNGAVFGNGTSLRFKASSLTGIENPATKTIVLYKRPTPGSGEFTAVGTLTYDAATDEFYVAGITGFSEFVMASDDAPLPVELTSFTARAAGSVVNLNWETATEVDNNGFDVERNSTGTWQKIGFVEGHGTANSPKYYNFTDKSVTGNKIQYRLRQVDNDGSFEYSNVVEVELAPTTFALDQNYPNPFNPATVIRFSLPTASVVTLTVYNTLGEKVVTLLNGAMESGYHQVSFDAANLPSGLYLYEIKAGEFSSIKKMLLMK